jgi:hypothetical protein
MMTSSWRFNLGEEGLAFSKLMTGLKLRTQ